MARLYYYEPKPVPRLDGDGNPIGYEYPKVNALSLHDSDNLRVKNFPNEKGLSADPENVTGFHALIDLINQNRNLRGDGFCAVGCDDLSTFLQLHEAEQKLDSFQNPE